MLHLDKIAICRFSPRHFSSPSIVALLPQRENGSDVYSGFHVITLPFVDEFRTVPNNLKIEVGQGSGNSGGGVDEQLVDLAKVVVERTMFKEFNPKSVENIGREGEGGGALKHLFILFPNLCLTLRQALQHHYAYLQAIALKRDEPEYCEDKTMPKWERIKKRTGSQIADFNKRARAVMLEERGSVCAKEEDDENGEDDENERIEKLVKRNNRNGTVNH